MILFAAADHCLVGEIALTFLTSEKWSDRRKESKKDIFKISVSFVQCRKN